jgi:hypothetical protein
MAAAKSTSQTSSTGKTAKKPAKKPAKKNTNKTGPTGVSVAAFIAALESPTRRREAKAIAKLFRSVSGKTAKMWGPTMVDFGPLLAKLGKHRTGRSCLYINRLEDINFNVLEKIARRGWNEMKKKYPE